MSVNRLIVESGSKVATSCLLSVNCINHHYLDIVDKCRGRQSWPNVIKCMKVDRRGVQIRHDLAASYAKKNWDDRMYCRVSTNPVFRDNLWCFNLYGCNLFSDLSNFYDNLALTDYLALLIVINSIHPTII